MRQLILMRHGKAQTASGSGDHARPLSERGRAEAAEAARRLAAVAAPAFALVSDSMRTRETFASASPAFAPSLPHRFTRALYGATAEAILGEVRAGPDEAAAMLVIGHNPGIGDLARRLAGSGDPAGLRDLAGSFPTACFAILDLDGEGWGGIGAPGQLRFLLPRGERSGD